MEINRDIKKRAVVFIVGAVPPPIGGITIHIQRLVRILQDQGYLVEVFDFLGRRAQGRQQPEKQENITIWTGTRGAVLLKLLARILLCRPSVIHWHISVGEQFIRLSPLILLLNYINSSIYTIHSGSFSTWLKAKGIVHKFFFHHIFQSAKTVIAVNQDIQTTVRDYLGVSDLKIEVVPAYLHPLQQFMVQQKPCENERKIRIIASGYATRIYWWEGLFEAIARIEQLEELYVVFYNTYDQPYYSTILAQAKQISSCRVSIFNDLVQQDFLDLMSQCTMFIRPTLYDGDSLAVREALVHGMVVVASDVVSRPEGCILFKTGNSKDLRKKILFALSLPDKESHLTNDFAEDLLSVYQSILQYAFNDSGPVKETKM